MNSKTGKLAAAAAVVIAVLLALQVWSPLGSNVTFAQAIQPILNANTAILDIIVGTADANAPVIQDMIMGSRIRRTVGGMKGSVSIIDLETSRVLALTEAEKEAVYIDLKGLPSIPNYLDNLKNVFVELQNSPHFEIQDLGTRQVDGHEAVGFLAKHPRGEITLWADAKTGLPVRIEQKEGQMLVTCKNLQFDVPMDDALFSMEVPEGYHQQQMELDLRGSTEEDFIEGLRILAETFGDGQFPDGVGLEDYLRQAADMEKKTKELGLSSEEEMALGMKLQKYLLFLRFYKGQGKWYYRGQGVKLGEAAVPIFWCRPKGSETYRVIYGDLHVEDVAPEDLPEPLDPDDTVEASVSYQQWSKPDFVGSQEDYWHFLADGRIRVKAYLTLLKGPEDTSVMPIRLPYPNAPLEAVLLDGKPLTFHQTGDGAYDVELPAEKPAGGEVKLLCQWHLTRADFQEATYGYQVPLQALVPVVSYKLKVALEDGCGLEFAEPLASTKDPSDMWAVPFSMGNPPKPMTTFGSCGIAVQKRE